MTYAELLQAIPTSGIELQIKLVVYCPRELQQSELMRAIAEHEPHLLAKLGRDVQWEALSKQRWGPGLDQEPPLPQIHPIGREES